VYPESYPSPEPPPKKSYAAAARGDEWTTVGISRQMPTTATQAEAEIVQTVEEVAEGTEHVPLYPERHYSSMYITSIW
jgi:hypothetical protein